MFWFNYSDPKVHFKTPEPYQVFVSGQIVNMTAIASDSDGIAYVEFRIGSIIVGIDSKKPYQASFNSNLVPLGYHNISVNAVDNLGNSASEISGIFIE